MRSSRILAVVLATCTSLAGLVLAQTHTPPAEWRACSSDADCVLVVDQCCWCGTARADRAHAIARSHERDWRGLVCGGDPHASCPSCVSRPPALAVSCVASVCTIAPNP